MFPLKRPGPRRLPVLDLPRSKILFETWPLSTIAKPDGSPRTPPPGRRAYRRLHCPRSRGRPQTRRARYPSACPTKRFCCRVTASRPGLEARRWRSRRRTPSQSFSSPRSRRQSHRAGGRKPLRRGLISHVIFETSVCPPRRSIRKVGAELVGEVRARRFRVSNGHIWRQRSGCALERTRKKGRAATSRSRRQTLLVMLDGLPNWADGPLGTPRSDAAPPGEPALFFRSRTTFAVSRAGATWFVMSDRRSGKHHRQPREQGKGIRLQKGMRFRNVPPRSGRSSPRRMFPHHLFRPGKRKLSRAR